MKIANVARPTAFRKYKKIASMFEEKKKGVSPYLKWKVNE
jgi:hypothetical protein